MQQITRKILYQISTLWSLSIVSSQWRCYFLPRENRVGPPGENITYVVRTMLNAQILNQLVPDVQICTYFLWREMGMWLNNNFLSYLLWVYSNAHKGSGHKADTETWYHLRSLHNVGSNIVPIGSGIATRSVHRDIWQWSTKVKLLNYNTHQCILQQ